MVFGDPVERKAYLNLVDAFHDAHPDIQVEVTHIPSPRDYRTRLATEFAAGSPPDVMLMNYRRYAGFAAKNLLEPLDSYVAESDDINLDDFYEIAIDGFMWRDELMCIPQNISSLVVYYNTDLFDQLGVPYPNDNWTWDDFLATAKALTADINGDGVTDQYGLGTDPSLFRVAPFVWQNGGPIVDSDIRPTRLTLTRYPTLKGIEWFIALQTVHGVVPDRVSEASQDSESRFVAGTIGMFLNSRRGTPAYREIKTFNWDVAPLPSGVEPAGVLHSDGYCMSASAEDKSAVFTFIEFANSIEGQSIIAASGRTVPSRPAVANSPVFLNPDQLPKNAAVWLETADTLRRVPVISTWQEIENTASAELERAFYGDISPEEAARLANQRTEEYFLLGQTAEK